MALDAEAAVVIAAGAGAVTSVSVEMTQAEAAAVGAAVAGVQDNLSWCYQHCCFQLGWHSQGPPWPATRLTSPRPQPWK